MRSWPPRLGVAHHQVFAGAREGHVGQASLFLDRRRPCYVRQEQAFRPPHGKCRTPCPAVCTVIMRMSSRSALASRLVTKLHSANAAQGGVVVVPGLFDGALELGEVVGQAPIRSGREAAPRSRTLHHGLRVCSGTYEVRGSPRWCRYRLWRPCGRGRVIATALAASRRATARLGVGADGVRASACPCGATAC